MQPDHTNDLLRILDRLDAANIHWTLRRTRPDAVSIDASVPGQRWEIDVMADGFTEVEVFRSDGTIGGSDLLDALLTEQRS